MAVQDRNVHRDAILARKALGAVIAAPANADEDEPIFVAKPRYNFRVQDIAAYSRDVGVADATLRAQVVQNYAVAGAPQFSDGAAVTFGIEAFWQNDDGVLTRVAATAAQAFSQAFTVLDGGWGVVLVLVDDSQVIRTVVPGLTMAYATEEDALNACPAAPSDEGVLGVLTIEASGADFVAQTDDTDTANAFNTFDKGGHAVTLVVDTDPQAENGVLATVSIDPAGQRILDGRASQGAATDDLLVVTCRSAGAPTFTEGQLTVETRPFPLQGEGRGNASASQTSPLFTP